MKHVIAAEFVVEFIDANNSDATAGGPTMKDSAPEEQVFRSSRARASLRRSLPTGAGRPRRGTLRQTPLRDAAPRNRVGRDRKRRRQTHLEQAWPGSFGRAGCRESSDRPTDQVLSGSSTMSRRGGSHRSRLSTSSSGRSITTSSSRWLRARKPSVTAWSRNAVSPS